jgi:hypothetical protein
MFATDGAELCPAAGAGTVTVRVVVTVWGRGLAEDLVLVARPGVVVIGVTAGVVGLLFAVFALFEALTVGVGELELPPAAKMTTAASAATATSAAAISPTINPVLLLGGAGGPPGRIA